MLLIPVRIMMIIDKDDCSVSTDNANGIHNSTDIDKSGKNMSNS